MYGETSQFFRKFQPFQKLPTNNHHQMIEITYIGLVILWNDSLEFQRGVSRRSITVIEEPLQ